MQSEARTRKGILVVKSVTKGADVFVNGRKIGRTPLRKRVYLKPGTHTLRVSKLGFADYLDSIKIRRGRKTVVEPELFELNGILQIDSTPANAQVVINGRMFGHTPLQEALAPGGYALEVRLSDHQTFKKNVEIEAGQEVTLAPMLLYEAPMVETQQEPWYRNKWVWIGAASVIVTTSIITAVALTADDTADAGYPTIRIETTQ